MSEEYDTVKLGNHVLPGVWTVEDGEVKRVFDLKKSPGREGATIKDEGYQNGTLRLVGLLTTKEQWDVLQHVIDDIHPQKKKAVKRMAIEHPFARLLGIRIVQLSKISVPTLENGILRIVIEVVEYVPILTKVGKPGKVDDSPYYNYGTPTGNAINGRAEITPAEVEGPDYLQYAPGAGV